MNRRQWIFILLFALGVCVISSMLGTLLEGKAHHQNIPPGWQIIRPPHVVFALAAQGDIIWAGGKDGVYGLDRQSGAIVTKLECDLPLEYVQAVLVDRSGMLWVGHFGGLTGYDGTTCRTYTQEDGLPDNRVNALLQDRDGRLWVGTWGGAAVREGGGWRVLTSADGLADDMVNVMLQDHEGGMWFGSYVAPRGGISYFKDGKWQLFSTANGLPHNNITTLLEDHSGEVWAGTGLLDRGGAVQFGPIDTGWVIQQVLTRRDGLAGDKVRSIFQDRDGVIWFGSEYDGLARLDAGQWSVLTEKDGLSHPEVMSMLQDVEGNLWIGTRDGVTRVSASALKALEDLQSGSGSGMM